MGEGEGHGDLRSGEGRIRTERLRRDVAAYARNPPNDDDLVFADLPVQLDLDDDDVDYDVWYGRTRD